ncbi:MAG: L-erythro-3,5-diaminohexanoate dehydrogenase [Nocardiopsaceae bacterium]|nr:L-erythro-3,5-diaminohexanoate dehydrogenase [Nocardiopsaceae bacterium]
MARSADARSSLTRALGLHRVADPDERRSGVLPQAASRLDPDPHAGPGEVRIRVDRLNLDAASYRQLRDAHHGDGDAIRAAVAEIIGRRGKMHNPVTGSGGMLTGVVEEADPESPLGLKPGDRVATLVSLTLTPLRVYDGLRNWDGLSEQVPCDGHAILFARSIAAVLPDDLPVPLALSVMDVCGAPALTRRVVAGLGEISAGSPPERRQEISPASPSSTPGPGPVVAILGAAGKSGSLSAAAARDAGAASVIGVVRDEEEASLLREVAALHDVPAADPVPGGGRRGRFLSGVPQDCRRKSVPSQSRLYSPSSPLYTDVVVADAREPVPLAEVITARGGGAADVTVVCVDAPGCEGGAILATRQGGTVIFFSMATSFSAAALGAEGVAADVTMVVGNGYVPGHAEYALELIRANAPVRRLFERRTREAREGHRERAECAFGPALAGPSTHLGRSERGGSGAGGSGAEAGGSEVAD